jgi:flagellar protein FlaG
MKIQDINDTVSTGLLAKQSIVAGISNVTKSTSVSEVKETKQPSAEQLQASIKQISDDLKKSQTNLDFSIDKSTKEVVVKVIDSSTGDVLTQFPSKQALAIAESVVNQQKGTFLNKTA